MESHPTSKKRQREKTKDNEKSSKMAVEDNSSDSEYESVSSQEEVVEDKMEDNSSDYEEEKEDNTIKSTNQNEKVNVTLWDEKNKNKLKQNEKLDFDNKYYSMGVIWLFEEIAEVYLNNKDCNNFFLMLYKIFRYTDNALADLTQLFNGLRYYNKFNIYSFATSIIRLNHLKNVFQNKLNFKLVNLKLSDEIFLNSDNFISKSRFNYTFDKLTLSKYNKYIERWLIAHEDELVELSSNTAVIEDAKRVINDYISTLE